MRLIRFVSVFLLIMMLAACACIAEEAPALRGYDLKTRKYQYATFGVYPYEKDGTMAPVLWRVLGRGIAAEDDVIGREQYDHMAKKYANRDEFTQENDDVFLLMTEYIIDTVLYHPVRDTAEGPGLDYADTNVKNVLCNEILPLMLTPQEQRVLVEMPGRGLLSLPSRRGEMFHPDYGFVEEDFTVLKRRSTTGTPYAYAQGLRRIAGDYSWYWTTDWRAPGRRWIVGDNGHISVSGLDREGGIRPICYVHADMLRISGGDGTKDNPFILEVK
ncbi:MAG: hypothetical protein IKU38_01605 [Clostridia bacterium]|nr:hypothetical protein [Clostridia bacterium]